MAAYHWYFVGAAYGLTAFLTLVVVLHSWRRMVIAERRIDPLVDTPPPGKAVSAQ
jgi:hypothetical protein